MTDTDSLRLIQETAVKAAGGGNRIVSLPGEPPGVYGVLNEDGEIEKRVATRKPRSHRILSLGEIRGAIEHYAKLNEEIVPIVWYSPELIRVVLDDASGSPLLDSINLALKERKTEAWDLVQSGLTDISYSQKEFIKLLRNNLWDCIGEAGAMLIKQVRALDWSMGSNTQSTIDKSRSSYGTDIESEVRSKHGEFPDDVFLSVRLYDDPLLTMRRTIRCAFEADPVSRAFSLTPYAGEMEKALSDEMEHIGEILEGELDCTVLYGTSSD